jgi:cobalt/nickel transport system permease protein
MKHRIAFAFYLLFIILLSSLSSIKALLLASFILSLFLSFRVFKEKSLSFLKPLAIAFLFSLLISLPYAVLEKNVHFPLLISLRTLCMASLTLIFIRTFNLYSALSFSKSLSYLLVLSVSHLLLYRRSYKEFMQALKSRSPGKPNREELLSFTKSTLECLFEKALRDAEETSQAMRSRGFSDG